MTKKRPEYSEGPFMADLQRQGSAIANSWRPSARLCQQLESQGLNRQFINGELRIQFVTGLQQQDVRNADWDELFKQYALQRAPASHPTNHQQPTRETFSPGSSTNPQQVSTQRATAMSDDWRPSDNMVELIMATICPNADYLKAQLISFTSHFHGQYNPNWDQQFKKWVNNGWNVYGHKNNFGKNNKEERSFVEKHTDMSWTDGL
ncbi:DnaT-like ssDNA-binding domain-containing protein [Oceanicoccus sp. KOV_DT_Chl]|uniref:DnaT-like ssDNA-binding domain-containing protein n=1 Tax=Oceanicoccus sp. KOV_DT_Chl TaxID=1904639 RepID=UPI000C7D827C|nr:DnaT-like ssDNA-binding domain-containing protein [Oceanicoccus sp. KOV_DT_Chl]